MEALPEPIKGYMTILDGELSKLPLAVQFEEKTKVPKAFAAAGGVLFVFVLIFFNIMGNLLTNLIGFVYPAYASFKAIESTDKSDDVQWLTYWVVFGFLNVLEFFSDIVLYWVPFYYLIKTLAVLWLVLPQSKGAEVVYNKVLKPFVVEKLKVA